MADNEAVEAEISREIFIQRAEAKYGPTDVPLLMESAASWIPDKLARLGLIDDEIGDYLLLAITASAIAAGASFGAETLH